jgi:amino acid adenylation domain-containing protein/non-ribosomal peptide synthase protein (TIGR01720 family)
VCTASLEPLHRIQDQNVDSIGLYLAAWSLLLKLYVGADEVCFGVAQQPPPSSTRNGNVTDEFSSLRSYTVCRILFEKDQKASDVVLDCKASLEASLQHTCSSLSELFHHIGTSRQGQFNTAVYLDRPEYTLDNDVEYFDMALIVRRSMSDKSTSCYLQFSSSHLSASTAALVAANYRTIVSQLVSNPISQLEQLNMLSTEDLEKTWSWNRESPAPIDSFVHDFIANNVLSRPNAPAISASDMSFTYMELDIASNVLANFLVREGIRPEMIVPLCFSKSAWATVSMLAVIKAGGAFTFLDPSSPIEALKDIVRQTDAKFLLCSTSNSAAWDGLLPAYEVSARSIAALPQYRNAPKNVGRSSNLLYVVFTSGSTGKPKGVCVEHSGFLSSALDFIKATGMNSSTRVLHFAAYSFDASIFENFTALLCGGCLCTPDESSRDLGIPHFINEFAVTLAFFIPSLVTTFGPNDVPSLDTLILMGEAPTKASLDKWIGYVRLINAYGPSECCVASSVNPNLELQTEPGNIGWPVGGLLWVVDSNNHNKLAPIGAVGELAIEGPHLGRGYLKSSEKTAKAFIDAPDWTADFPFSRSRRVYLTGDIVRRNIDGSVVFIGRRDTQVKVRGMRIELGAIEQRLSTDRMVKSVTVIVPNDGALKKRLVALLSIEDVIAEPKGGLEVFKFVDSTPEVEQVRESIRRIRDRLGQQVPGYMVPSHWFVLKSFPLMPSGKIHKVKVKAWIDEISAEVIRETQCLINQDNIDDGYEEALTPVVQAISREISLVLNLPFESVTTSKSFIGLGGDSISALQLMSQCRAQNMMLTVRQIMQSKSIVKLSQYVRPSTRHIYELQRDTNNFFDVPFDLSPIQQLFFHWEPEGTHAGGNNRFNQSFLLRVKRPISLESLATALKVLVERHPMLRCRFVRSSSSKWQQIIPKEVANSFRWEEYWVARPEIIQEIILKSQCAIDMVCGPVFIVDLINEPNGQLLSMIAHHTVVDLVSWRVIIRELEFMLDGGENRALQPHKSLPWPTWCRLQAGYASQHLPPRIALPNYTKDLTHLDYLRYWGMEDKENKFRDTTRMAIHLDSAKTSFLMEPERHQDFGTEPVDLFLSVIVHSFIHTFIEKEIPTIFLKSHGREPWDDSINVSSTVGWFTAMYPILMKEGGRDLVDTLRRVKDARRRVPSNGWSYFASTFHHPEAIREFGLPTNLEVIFDFLGLYQQFERSDSLFEQQVWENSDIGPDFRRPGLFEITAEVTQGQLQLKFEYNRTMKHQDSITRWIQECEKNLNRITSELDATRIGGHCMHDLSDFPLLRMGYDGLDNLFQSVLPSLTISAENVEDIYDTSPMQTGMLLSQAKNPALYQCSTVFQIKTTPRCQSLDLQRLSNAWQSLVQRHSALRTIFIPGVSDENAFCQVVLRTVDPRITPVSCLKSDVDAVLKAPSHLPLHDGRPPNSLTICQASHGETYIRLDINHACIDGASGHIFVKDFVALYEGIVQLPKAPVYRDFISKIRECNLDKDVQYWKEYLRDVEPCHLPILDDGIPQDGSLQKIQVMSRVSIESLSRFCQSHGITIPTILKTAWSIVLRAYTGSETACFGYLVSGRDDLGEDEYMMENMFGVLANILVCHCDLSETLESLLSKIHQRALGDLDHQYCSLAHIQRSLDSNKLASQQPLFNTILNFQVRPNTAAGESSIELCEMSLYEPTEYSCVVDIATNGEHFEISVSHWTSSLSRGQADNVAEAFLTAIEAIIQAPATILGKEIDLFGESHSRQVWTWNRIVPPRIDMCIHDVISRNAGEYPDASAIESWDAALTYGSLDEITTQLACHLSHLGVGSGSIVPLCFAKSAWAIVSLLAVLKAGGAFVLLSPDVTAPGRIDGIIRDTGSKIIIAGGERESLLLTNSMTTINPVVLIVDKESISQLRFCFSCNATEGRKPAASPHHPAYIFYTSGTTGTPKGSVNTHSSFCTAATRYWERVGMSPRSRVLQFASYTFDVCLSEILAVLMFGGTVCVPHEKQRTENIVNVMNEARVNMTLLTPSVARLITPTEVPTLEILALCGEAVTKADVAHWKGHVQLANSYGPSECSVVTTVNECMLDDPTNIGRPTGSLCWVADPENHERLMPIGAVGELIIEGHNVANGYFNDDRKTAEAFIKPPAWLVQKRLDSGQQVLDRVYKTGDLVRYNSDGTMQFVGRRDTQTKLRGQRMELGEVEHHLLLQSSLIRAVAVEVIQPKVYQDRQVLAAFFVPIVVRGKDEAWVKPLNDTTFLDLPKDLAIQLQALQETLANFLPLYMIPSLLIPVPAFPLSSSGKLDRKALRKAAEKISAAQLYEYSLSDLTGWLAPESDREKTLHKAWVEVLGSPPEMIGRNTNFFRAGGDSLGAMKLASITRNKYNLILTVATIFECPLLCDMAMAIVYPDTIQGSEALLPETDIEPFALLPRHHSVNELISEAAIQCQVQKDDILDLYPCTPLQEGLITISMENKAAYVRQNVFLIPETLDIDRLKRAWETVVAANPILRTRIISIDSIGAVKYFQVVLNDHVTWLHGTCSRQAYLAEDLDMVITWGSQLSRFAILAPDNSDDDHLYLVWTIHHALFDEWSLRLTMEQLRKAYHGETLPATLPFNCFVAYTTNGDDSACTAFWAEQMSGIQSVSLPHTLPNAYVPKVADYDEGTIDLVRESGQHITTPTLLRAAWALVTAQYAATENIAFGASVHGRSAAVPRSDRINGPTMATVPIKVYVGREVPISSFVERIQMQAARMISYAHWGLPNIARVGETVPGFQNLLVVHLPDESENYSSFGLTMLETTNFYFHQYPLVMECFLMKDTGRKARMKISYDKHVVPYAPQLKLDFEWLVQQLILRVDDNSPLGTLKFPSLENNVSVFSNRGNHGINNSLSRKERNDSDENYLDGANMGVEKKVRGIIAKALGLLVDQVSLDSSFISLGGDSITAISITARCYAKNIIVRTTDILRSRSIRELASRAKCVSQDQDALDINPPKLGYTLDTFRLTPIQRFYFNSLAGHSSQMSSSHFNQSVLLQLTQSISIKEINKAVLAIVQQHGMLRTRFTYNQREGNWTQRILPATGSTSVVRHHVLTNSYDMDSIIASTQRRLDAVSGDVFAVDSFTITSQTSPSPEFPQKRQTQHLLFMVAHHLVVDLVSWRIIVQGLEEFLTTGRLPSSRSYSYQAWATMLERYATQNLDDSTKLANLFKVPKSSYSYWGVLPSANTFGETLNTTFSLDIGPTTALLSACNDCFGTKPDDLLISALLASFISVFKDRDTPPVFCEGHGRDGGWDDMDLSSTVGWFTVIYPLYVELPPVQGFDTVDLVDAARRTKDARVRAAGNAGSYFASRFLTKYGETAFEDHWPMEILFNYLGGYQNQEKDDALLVPVARHGLSPSPNHTHDSLLHDTADVGAECRRAALFDIHVEVGMDGKAIFNLTFNRGTPQIDKIYLWMSKYREFLLKQVDQLTDRSPEPTLSSFPLLSHLTYENIERIKSVLMPVLGLSKIDDIADVYPCGPAQKGILISQARSPDAYKESFLYKISSLTPEPVSLEKLEAAWKTVVARHDVLRTVLVEDRLGTGEGYYQVVLRDWSPRVRCIEYSDNLIATESMSQALESMHRLSAATTSSTAKTNPEPAHSMLFCRTATGDYMYLEISHALLDASSMPVLLGDLATVYGGGGNHFGLIDELKAPRYADYISHVREISLGNSMNYWMAYLNDIQPCHIPILKGSGVHPLHISESPGAPSVGSVPIELGAISKSISAFCLGHGLTPASIFKVSWALVLRLYTGMDNVCFGFLASGRDASIQGIEKIVGLVCNMLVVRMHVPGDKTGIGLLKEAQDDWLDSIEHQFVSLAELQHQHRQTLSKASSAAVTHSEALFNTAISLTGSNSGPRFDNSTVSHASIAFDVLGGSEGSEYDGAVSIWSSTENVGFSAQYTYKLSHMTEAQAKSLARAYSKAIEYVIEKSSSRLRDWGLVMEDDVTSGLTKDSNNPATVTTGSETEDTTNLETVGAFVDEAISVAAQRVLDRSAVCSWDGQLTYRELETLSSQLAHHLVANYGVGPEVLVPVCMEKSFWFVVSIMAVLKAGGAFVPMDGTQPARFLAIFQQTNARLVLTSETLTDRICEQPGNITALVVNDQLMQKLPRESLSLNSHGLHYRRHAGNAAYVMFTSGSTGTPKGVVIEHRAWCASAVGWIEGRSMNEQTRNLQFASYSFDAAIGDILGTLMAGGCVCIPSESERLDDIEKAINRMQVNMVDLPPSMLGMLKPENIPSVQIMVIAGESAPEYELRRWYSQVQVVLAYGPTECSVESSYVTRLSLEHLKPSNIGFPKKMCRYWVVSEADHNVLLPTGAIGELLIEGVRIDTYTLTCVST